MFKGSIVALITPFKNNKLDVDCYIALINHHLKSGTSAIVPAGTTGESPTLTETERLTLYSTVKKAVGDRATIIAGTGTNNTAESIQNSVAAEKAGADAILIHSKKQTADEIFEFSDSWGGDIPLVIVPTSYPSITLKQIQSHKIKMVIYANQTLRATHASLSKILKQMINSNSLSEVKEEISSMEEIFKLQETYDIKTKEKELENELKKLGYIS